MPTLNISDKVRLPLDAVTQTLAAIGRKGAGKTYLAQLIAEQMLDAEAQVVAIDPVGNWWGLRVGANGRSPGKELFVLGGEHGDLPLLPEAGARIARLLTEKRVSAVLDLSSFRQGERKRFAWEFAEEFFHRKKTQRSAVHVFVEEAQLFIPQRVGPDEARMVGAFESIIRLGRNYGIGATLVTQRPQSVNKEVLSQVECLCVLQVNGTHERKALEEWVQEAGADRKLVGELPGLHQGEGYIWSPSWLRIFQRVRFGKKTTFDASATPEVGRASKAATLTSVDVDALRKDLAEVVSKAEADDPKVLRRRIAELEREARKAPINTLRESVKVESVEVPVLSPVERAELEKLSAQLVEVKTAIDQVRADFGAALDEFHVTFQRAIKPKLEAAGRRTIPAPVARINPSPRATSARNVPPRVQTIHGTIPAAQRRLLGALAWLEAVGIPRPDKTQVALFADLTPGAGHTNNNFGALHSAGLITYPAGGTAQLSEAGRAVADPGPIPQTAEEMHTQLLGKLPKAQRELLRVLIECYPDPMAKDQVAEAAGLTPGAGHTNNNFGRLRSLGLIDYPSGGVAVATPVLFLEVGR